LLEGRHFFSDVDPRALGHKALAVNLSDLAAMGATPIACVLGLGLPAADEAWVAAFSEGFLELGARLVCPLIGGDTTRSSHGIVISVTVFGSTPPSQALRRDAACIGDDIWVSGSLGAADVAYRLLAGLLPTDAPRLAQCRQALEWPEPRVALGTSLLGIAHAALDLSDGLVQDLGHILTASRVGADLDYAALPVHTSLAGMSAQDVQTAVLGGGDVYELCFTAAPSQADAVRAAARASATPVTRIGSIRAGSGLVVRDTAGLPLAVTHAGFDHFSHP